jgi:hypothetical protein
MQGKTLGGAGTDTRQPFELVDQASQWSGEAAQRSVADPWNLSSGAGG